jgi:hypothetical protein
MKQILKKYSIQVILFILTMIIGVNLAIFGLNQSKKTSLTNQAVSSLDSTKSGIDREDKSMTEKPPYPQNYFDTVLAENFVISSEEQEINLEKKVKAEKLQQFIRLVLEPPYEDGVDIWAKASEPGIVTPSGEKTNPEIRVIDENGKEYNMTYSGQSGKQIVLYGNNEESSEDHFSKGLTFKKLFIKSKLPIKVKYILWSNYEF